MPTQPEFTFDPRITAPVTAREVTWFIDQLRGRDWATAEELLTTWERPVNEQSKRRLRALAEASGGQISG